MPHGKDIAIFLGDTDVSAFLNANAVTVNNELADTSAYADEDRNFIGGLITGNVTLGGHFDQASGAITEELENSLKVSTLLSVAYGAALSDRWIGMALQASNYTVADPVGDVVVVNYTAQAEAGGVSRGTVLHPLANVETTADEETKVDQAAATTLGCVGFVHLVAFTGDNITITIEDGATEGGAFNDLVSFAQLTDIGKQRVAVAAAADTPDRWVKVSWTGTFTSATFIVGMERI